MAAAETDTRIEIIPLEVRQSEALRKQQNRANIIDEANNFAQRVSLIGLTHATNSKAPKSRRIVWMFWLVFGFGLAVYQIQDRVVYFCSYPYNTEFEIRTAKELRFPQVTVCKEDWMSKSKAKKFGIDEIIESHFQWIVEEASQVDGNNSDFNERYRQFRIQLHNSTQDWKTLIRNISHERKDLVPYISWDGQYNDSLIEDAETDLGQCFSIGSDTKPLIATEPGIRAGLEMVLNAKQSDSVFISIPGHEIFTGFRLLIHDPYEVPRMLEAGFVISPGTVTQVAVTFENVTQLGPPYSDCNTDPDYRVVNCLAYCEDDFFMNKCNCRPFYLLISAYTEQTPVCSLVEHMDCLIRFTHSRKTSDDYRCNCSQQCIGRMYDYSLSQSKISEKLLRFIETTTRARARALQQLNDSSATTTVENTCISPNDLTIIYIYFPNLMYKDYTSAESYSFLALLCDVGGALSLLLGATLLTVYEVAEFLALVARDFLCSRIRR